MNKEAAIAFLAFWIGSFSAGIGEKSLVTEDQWLNNLKEEIRKNIKKCESNKLNEYCTVKIIYLQHRKQGIKPQTKLTLLEL